MMCKVHIQGTYDRDGDRLGLDPGEHFDKLVCVYAEAVERARARQGLVSIFRQVRWMAPAYVSRQHVPGGPGRGDSLLRILPHQAQAVEVVAVPQQRILDDRVERIHHILPHRLLRRECAPSSNGRRNAVVSNHVALVRRHAQRAPQELLVRDDEVAEVLIEYDRPEPRAPYRALIPQRPRRAHVAHLPREQEQAEEPLRELDSEARPAGLVQPPAGGEGGGVVEPILERARGEVRGELVEEEVAELRVAAFPKEFPRVLVGERAKRCDLELEEVVLRGVEVDRVDAAGAVEGVVEDVVARGGDREHDVVLADVQQPLVLCRVLPRECVDVLVAKLCVLLQRLVVVQPPALILVEERRERNVRCEVQNRRFKALRPEL